MRAPPSCVAKAARCRQQSLPRSLVTAVGRLKRVRSANSPSAIASAPSNRPRARPARHRNHRNSRKPRARHRAAAGRGIDRARQHDSRGRRSWSCSMRAARTSTARRWPALLREWRGEDRAGGLLHHRRRRRPRPEPAPGRAKLDLAFGTATWPHQLVRGSCCWSRFTGPPPSYGPPVSSGLTGSGLNCSQIVFHPRLRCR